VRLLARQQFKLDYPVLVTWNVTALSVSTFPAVLFSPLLYHTSVLATIHLLTSSLLVVPPDRSFVRVPKSSLQTHCYAHGYRSWSIQPAGMEEPQEEPGRGQAEQQQDDEAAAGPPRPPPGQEDEEEEADVGPQPPKAKKRKVQI
jgi:hypothetical protein